MHKNTAISTLHCAFWSSVGDKADKEIGTTKRANSPNISKKRGLYTPV
jgi:hypothetical protein